MDECRNTQKEDDDGTMNTAVRPYLMDLGSVNGTYLNAERIEAQRYYELFEKVCPVMSCMLLTKSKFLLLVA